MSNIYFVRVDRTAEEVTVIDISQSSLHERDEFSPANELNYILPGLAISAGRDIAKHYGFKYKLFESRYNESLNEPFLPPIINMEQALFLIENAVGRLVHEHPIDSILPGRLSEDALTELLNGNNTSVLSTLHQLDGDDLQRVICRLIGQSIKVDKFSF